VFRFEISGKPTWASFDVLTGNLTGTPAAGDEGLYTGIKISVTDGIDTVTLQAFSIEVVAAGTATGSVTLNWTPPTQNEDGSQLTNLAAYRILWSRDGSSFRNSVRVNNPSVTRYVVENLTPGTYEFSATAINSAGVESRFSNSITKVVQ
jgi:predicted phage tail protein